MTDSGDLTCGDGDRDQEAFNVENISGADHIISIENGVCVSKKDSTIKCLPTTKSEVNESNPLENYKNITDYCAGNHRDCVVKVNGTVSCFEKPTESSYDLLYTTIKQRQPLNLTGIISIDCNHDGFIVLDESGHVYSWKEDVKYIDGKRILDVDEPKQVQGIVNATDISLGYSHACAVIDNKEVKCWGNNQFGQLGNGRLLYSKSPVEIVGIENAVTLSVNGVISPKEISHGRTCIVDDDKRAHCPGAIGFGYRPNEIDSLSGCGHQPEYQYESELQGINYLSTADFNACALFMNGSVKCFSLDYIRNPDVYSSSRQSLSPEEVFGPGQAVSLSTAGYLYEGGSNVLSCAIMNDGKVKCWGETLDIQQSSTGNEKYPPVDLPLDSVAEAISIDYSGVPCVVLTDGSVKCWRLNDSPDADGHFSEITFEDATSYSGGFRFASGKNQECVLLHSNDAKCWKRGETPPLWFGTTIPGSNEIDVAGITDIDSEEVEIIFGDVANCSISDNSTISCKKRASGYYNDSKEIIPVTVYIVDKARTASFTETHSCYITENGKAKCWGDNLFGELGDGVPICSDIPVNVVGLF